MRMETAAYWEDMQVVLFTKHQHGDKIKEDEIDM
jgi:hypothetical protein